MSNFKNSETPANPTTPITDQFNRTIMYLGFSKKEYLAMQLYISQYAYNYSTKHPVKDELNLIKSCYETAERFLNYESENVNTVDIITNL